MTDALRKALKLIDKHSAATIRTNSKDRGDWAEDMAYVGKVAREALAASAAPAVPPVHQSLTTVPAEPVAWHCPNDPDSATAFLWRRPSNGACPNCGKKLLPVVLAAAPTAQQEPKP